MTEPFLPEEAIFLEALEMPCLADRAVYLERVCGQDRRLRESVEALFRAHGRSGDLLDLPDEPAPTVDVPSVERAGSIIGPYKLLEAIGEGGFGVVYMAEQSHPLRRKVALKVLKPGMDSRQIVARFEAERQALALMEHLNVARVLDGGTTPSGRPYFAMELVKGVPITDFCDTHQLAPRERLQLFDQVCQAVQHAHQKGIIHRDLKPSNVLVTVHDTLPIVKVIDFGVAKALGQVLTERTLFTGFEQLIGTPAYMSPEQAGRSGLDVDTRSDIYSLGVLLYELLTGTTPFLKRRFERAGYDEIRRIIREEEPPKPSTRLSALDRDRTSRSEEEQSDRKPTTTLALVSQSRSLEPEKLMKLMRGELDWIVMKCLEKDRNRRYESASALAADVKRYLAKEPVQACPPTFTYRCGKLISRNKPFVIASALVVSALVVGTIGATWGMLRADDARREAIQETRRKERALLEKGVALDAARQSEYARSIQLWEAMLAQARANRLSRRSGQRFETLDTLSEAAALGRRLNLPEEKVGMLRDEAVAAMALPDLAFTPIRALPSDGALIDFDAAHALYAQTDRFGRCSVRRVADDAEVFQTPAYDSPHAGRLSVVPNLSPSGKYLMLSRYEPDLRTDHLIEVWSLGGTAPRKLVSEANVRALSIDPNDRIVALVYLDGSVGVFDLANGVRRAMFAPAGLVDEVMVALHPTEPIFASCSYFLPTLQLRDLHTGRVIATAETRSRPLSLAWRPDGRILAVGQESRPIELRDGSTLKLVSTLSAGSSTSRMNFNHRGDRLAATDWGGSLSLYDCGTTELVFSRWLHGFTSLQFRHDDSMLAGAIEHCQVGLWRLGDGREFRTLPHKQIATGSYSARQDLSPEGRLLAGVSKSGFYFWDAQTGRELGAILSPESNNFVRFQRDGTLLTIDGRGVARWPVRNESNGAGTKVTIGPPERLPLPPSNLLCVSDDAQVIATCCRTVGIQEPFGGGWIWHANRPTEPIRVNPGTDVGHIALSPDGKWLVTISFRSGASHIYDTSDGRLVKELSASGTGRTSFSPDSRWLLTGLEGGQMYEVGTWKPGPNLGQSGSFSPDGTMVVSYSASGDVCLIDAKTGAVLTHLDDSSDGTMQAPQFSPCGTKLIGGFSGNRGGVYIWDLRRVRERLRELGLDWDAPQFPPEQVSTGDSVDSIELVINAGQTPNVALSPEERSREAITRYSADLEGDPKSALAHNNLAWTLLIAPDSLRDVERAMKLAETAQTLDSSSPIIRNTFGLALYRSGRHPEAVAQLSKNLKSSEGRYLAFDLYILAMARGRMGEKERGVEYYTLADQWAEAHQDISETEKQELSQLRNEASEVLGLTTNAK